MADATEDGAGTSENHQGTEGEKPSYVTKDDLAAMVTGAVRAQLKKELSKQLETLPNLVQSAVSEAVKQSLPAQGDDDKTPQEKASRPDPKVRALEDRINQMESRLKQETERAENAEKKAREDRAYNDLRASLQGKVRDDALDMATKYLFHAEKRVTFDEDGNPLFVSKRSQHGTEEDVQLPMADGVAQYLKSKEAAAFLPAPSQPNPKNPNHQTRRPSRLGLDGLPEYDGPAKTDEEKIRRAQEREAALNARNA